MPWGRLTKGTNVLRKKEHLFSQQQLATYDKYLNGTLSTVRA